MVLYMTTYLVIRVTKLYLFDYVLPMVKPYIYKLYFNTICSMRVNLFFFVGVRTSFVHNCILLTSEYFKIYQRKQHKREHFLPIYTCYNKLTPRTNPFINSFCCFTVVIEPNYLIVI